MVQAANEKGTDGAVLARLLRGRPLTARDGTPIRGLEDARWEPVSGLASRALIAIGRPPAALVKWSPKEDPEKPWSYALRVRERSAFAWVKPG